MSLAFNPMRKVGALVLLIALTVAASASAGPSAESDATVNGTKIHQEINFVGSDLHYWFKATNPAGVPRFCVTMRLERKGSNGWRGIGKGNRRRSHFCCETDDAKCRPNASTGVWDLFVYPSKRLSRRLRKGALRVHGFTDLGPSLTIRL